jgi:CHAD domain-containing protein
MELDYVKLKEIKPALAGYIRESQTLLKLSSCPGEKVVHDVRVLMKKSRAALKLSGPRTDMDSFERDNKSLREVGRIMRFWRESAVQRKILKELRKEYPAIFNGLHDHEKLAALLEKTVPATEPVEEIKTGLELIMELLYKTGYRIRFQSMNTIEPQQLIKKFELTYKSVADIFLIARNNPKPENLHEFRKKTKTFLYQLYFFRPLNTSVIKALEKKLENLAQNLGKYNDLAQLVRTLGYKYTDGANLPALDELVVKIREKQDNYLAKVWPVSYKIFCPGQKLVNVLGFKLLVI